MRAFTAVLLAILSLAPGYAAANGVLIYPVEFVDISPYPNTSKFIETAVKRSGQSLAKIDENINLSEYRERCSGEALCLVQIGQLVDASKVVVIQNRRRASGTCALSIRALDTSSGEALKTINWDIEPGLSTFRKAIQVALKQLLSPPDASVVFELSPKKTIVSLYGRPLQLSESEEPAELWSGDYFLKAEAPGYKSMTRWMRVESGSFQRESIRLSANSALITEQSSGYISRAKPSRKIKRKHTNPWSRWLAWSLFAGGAISLGGGGLSMYSANQSYIELSGQSRNFNNESLLSAQEAMNRRDEIVSDYDNGRYVALTGGVALLASTLWILIDNLGGEYE